MTFEQDGQVLQVVEFQHVKPGRCCLCPFKTKNVMWLMVETDYNPTKFLRLSSERKDVTYLHSYEEDGDRTTSWTTRLTISRPTLPMC